MALNLSYPAWADTNEKKLNYLYRADALLFKLHNVMGDWYRNGITQNKYDKLPTKVKNRYPFTVGVKLTQAQWDDFLSGWAWGFERLWDKIHTQISQKRTIAKDDIGADVDFERDIT